MLDALILGAGPAGLGCASAVAERGGSLRILESSPRAGGAVQTLRDGGWTVELGPHTLQLESPADADLLKSLGLQAEMLDADLAAARRFIAWEGQLHTLGANPTSLLKSALLTFGGKCRLLAEIFVPRGTDTHESLLAFVERRMGQEVADRLLDPMVNGIFAGDPGRLIAKYTLPALVEMERKQRSILWALSQRRGAARRIIGFKGGLQRITEVMQSKLAPESLRTQATVTRLTQTSQGWQVAWRESDGTEHTAETRQLIITAPPWKWGSLPLETTLARVQQEGQRVEAPPLTLVVRGYDRKQVAHPLNGFGLLAPRLERRHVLGVLFPSSVFPDCAPEGKVLLSTFIGGTRAPEQAWLNDDATGKLVDQELGDLLGVQGPPERQWIMRWQQAIPQYHHGHGRFLEALAAAEQQHPGLHFVGNFRDGVSLMSTLRRGRELGRSLPLG